MNKRIAYFAAGALVAVSGSIVAATTSLPFQFAAGQKAKASEVNANFSALLSSVNGLDGRVGALESSANGSPVALAVTQVDLPVNSTVTIDGVTYTIVQFEVPRYDTDEVYLVKFPSAQNYAAGGNAFESVSIDGGYDGPPAPVTGANATTTLNGFKTLISEGFGGFTYMAVSDSGRNAATAFGQGLYAAVQLGPQTRVNIGLQLSPDAVSGSSPTRSADASGVVTTYPPTRTAAQRNAARQSLRKQLAYVTIKKKA